MLVCEGETDSYIFEALAEHFSKPEEQIKIDLLAPQWDATSGTCPGFGFGSVLNWCAANPVEKIQMLIDFGSARALFLQMDTDIAKQVNCGCIDRGHSARHCCEERINQQLKIMEEPDCCHYILPTENTETWILASHELPQEDERRMPINNYEVITNTEQRLIDLGYASRKSKNGIKRKLSKSPATRYKNHGEQLVANLTLARQRCNELDRLCTLMES